MVILVGLRRTRRVVRLRLRGFIVAVLEYVRRWAVLVAGFRRTRRRAVARFRAGARLVRRAGLRRRTVPPFTNRPFAFLRGSRFLAVAIGFLLLAVIRLAAGFLRLGRLRTVELVRRFDFAPFCVGLTSNNLVAIPGSYRSIS